MALLMALAATAASPCALPPGWRSVEERHPRYVIFGATHGTKEAPAMVAQIACALVRRHRRLLIAIEQQAQDDPALQALWSAPNSGFADRLKHMPGWSGRVDGVGSQAMFEMLVRLHGLSRSDHSIAVTSFNGYRDPVQKARFADQPGQGPHEAAHAENIRDAAKREDYDLVLVLTGSLHARKQPIGPGLMVFRPIAMQLAPVADVASLLMEFGGGTVWECLHAPSTAATFGKPALASADECASHPMPPMARFDAAPFVRMGDPPNTERDVYDGYLWIGPVTASEPVRP